MILQAITQGADEYTVHHRLGMVIEERGHARELFETTVLDDSQYIFGLADDWTNDTESKTDLKTDAVIDEGEMKRLIAACCQKHSVSASDSAYVLCTHSPLTVSTHRAHTRIAR